MTISPGMGGFVVMILHGVVICEYAIIAHQFYLAFKLVGKKNKAHKLLLLLCLIFGLCMVLGWVHDLFHLPWFLWVLICIPHIIVCGVFIVKNGARVVVSALDGRKLERDHSWLDDIGDD